MRITYIVFVLILLSSCTSLKVPQTVAAQQSGYTYIPVDPFPVRVTPGTGCLPRNTESLSDEEYSQLISEVKYKPILESLPDNAVRMSIEQFQTSGTVKYGPAGVGTSGESYRVTVDYVNSDTANFPIKIARLAKEKESGKLKQVELLGPLDPTKYDINSDSYSIKNTRSTEDTSNKNIKYEEYNIPVYVGIGLRVTANVDITAETANISGLGVIGVEAEANTLKGSLIVQTLGINGKSIAAALPIQSELNRTTAQNAIVAVGAIKALLYDEKTATVPRVVGIYLSIPGGKTLVNAIISELSRSNSIFWSRPCEDV